MTATNSSDQRGSTKSLSMTPTMKFLFIDLLQANLALEEDIFETEMQVYERIVQDPQKRQSEALAENSQNNGWYI